MLFINADDLGLNVESIVNTAQCYEARSVTSASLMVFMNNSLRASTWAMSSGIETGLHLNLTEPFDKPKLPQRLSDYHHEVIKYYRKGAYSGLLYNPLLKNKVDYVFKAQYDEYCRLFDAEPLKMDGHHHLHLSMNIILNNLIPKGMIVRRNFSFKRTEKNMFNRAYRNFIDAWLRTRYRCTDTFFSIKPLENLQRLRKIVQLSQYSDVEIAVHPADGSEYLFLLGSRFNEIIKDIPPGAFSRIWKRAHRSNGEVLP